MFLGNFYTGEKIKISICSHRFVDGEKYAGEIDLIYGLQDEDFDEGTIEEMVPVDDETGIYEYVFDTDELNEGMYWIIIQAVIDLVEVQQHFHLRVLNKPMWLIGMF